MIKLIESGLFGEGLIEVSSPAMVKRYNECLLDIGLVPTKLNSFHIDGWGWSPEIAEEQQDKFYHSHGFANPYGIIITPDQAQSSLYFPFHSFDWDIHHDVFEKYKHQIRDITTQCGLWFEMDQSITAYRAPQDLLMMENIQLHFNSVDGLMKAAEMQRKHVRSFYEDEDAWADVKLRDQIIESSKKFGDLRFRKVEIPSYPYNKISSFYSSTFGGVYILKDTPVLKPILILEQSTSTISAEMQHAQIEFNLDDHRLLSFLYGQHLLVDDVDFYINHIELLQHQMDTLLARGAAQLDTAVSISGLTPSRKKGLINQVLQKGVLDDTYFQLEEIVRKLTLKERVSIPSDTGLRNHLLHPDPTLDPKSKVVLWQILNLLLDNNEVLSYAFDKVKFYNKYKNWQSNYQTWVIQEILNNKGIYNRII